VNWRGIRRRVLVVARHSLRLLRTHYFTLASAAVIGILFALVMTSDAFISGERPSNGQIAPASSVVARDQAAASQLPGELASGPIAVNLSSTDSGAIYRWALAQPMR
jgi:hypothetical protein